MARARKTTHPAANGVSMLPGMPLAGLNSWNWWALAAPSTSMLTALQGAHTAMQAWRVGADGMRAAFRAQQNALLGLLEAPLANAREHEAAPEPAQTELHAEAADAAGQAELADFVTPMLEATRAYGRVGKAFIVAQRNTVRAFTRTSLPH